VTVEGMRHRLGQTGDPHPQGREVDSERRHVIR
jgi:hypothetical protein